jgi:hypothetical protein
MLVGNINGSSEKPCQCGSWRDHWENISGQKFAYCAAGTCVNRAEVGARVQVAGSRNWFIVPLCRQHNATRDASLIVSDRVKLVSANLAHTCGHRNAPEYAIDLPYRKMARSLVYRS